LYQALDFLSAEIITLLAGLSQYQAQWPPYFIRKNEAPHYFFNKNEAPHYFFRKKTKHFSISSKNITIFFLKK
jgi:hypothetical protein